MAKRSGQSEIRARDDRLAAVLDHMEPDLILLKGTVSLLQALSETSDAVEPVALEAVGRLADEVTERLTADWREACGVLRAR